MQRLDNWQRPATDDINPDALEYLFQKSVPEKTPWVRMANEAAAEPVARITPEYIRLQTRVEILKGIVSLTNEQLHEAHHKIGMLSAELARRDILLGELSDYRARAAMSIAYERQNELLKTRVEELQQAIQFLGEYAVTEEKATTPVIDASNYVVTNPRPWRVSTLAINTALIIFFAIAALSTIVH
jgi:hypothetical protein